MKLEEIDHPSRNFDEKYAISIEGSFAWNKEISPTLEGKTVIMVSDHTHNHNHNYNVHDYNHDMHNHNQLHTYSIL